VLGLIISWFGALVGPIAVPMLFGLLPAFKKCGPKAAILSIAAGLVTFIITKNITLESLALEVSLPLVVSTIVYIAIGFLGRSKKTPDQVKELLTSIAE
jgi:hypothetical protein